MVNLIQLYTLQELHLLPTVMIRAAPPSTGQAQSPTPLSDRP